MLLCTFHRVIKFFCSYSNSDPLHMVSCSFKPTIKQNIQIAVCHVLFGTKLLFLFHANDHRKWRQKFITFFYLLRSFEIFIMECFHLFIKRLVIIVRAGKRAADKRKFVSEYQKLVSITCVHSLSNGLWSECCKNIYLNKLKNENKVWIYVTEFCRETI